VSPSASGELLVDDVATIMEDLDDGYVVLQATERVPSFGMGHFVQDIEVLAMMN